MIPAAGYLLEQGRIVVRGPYHGSMGSRHRHGDESHSLSGQGKGFV